MNLSTIPRVSVGLPVYNGEKFIEESIASVLSQSFTDFELIICNNASTDRTGDICRKYACKDRRIIYVENERNIGASPNFNKTLTMARGEYFKWIAADDMIHPQMLEESVKCLDSDPKAVLACPNIQVIDDSGSRILLHDFEKLGTDNQKPRHRALQMYCGFPVGMIFGLMRTNTARELGGLRSQVSADYCFLFALSLRGRFFPISRPLILGRWHEEQFGQAIQRQDTDWQAKWYDPSNESKLGPMTSRLTGDIRSVLRSRIGLVDKLGSLLVIARAASWHWRTVKQELFEQIRASGISRSSL